MLDRSPTHVGSTAHLLRQCIIASALLIASASTARGQTAAGSMGVSLTILQPVATQAVQFSFTVNRAGIATLDTTSPVSGPSAQLVMTSISSSASNGAPVEQKSAMVRGSSAQRYLVDVGAARTGDADRRPVEVRIQYLAVAGT